MINKVDNSYFFLKSRENNGLISLKITFVKLTHSPKANLHGVSLSVFNIILCC